MGKKLKEFGGVIGFYILIILCIFLISNQNNYLSQKPKGVNINQVGMHK